MRFIAKLIGLILLFCLAAGLVYWYFTRPLALPEKTWSFTVKPGSSFKAIARDLQSAQIVEYEQPLVWLARLSGKDKAIKAGAYEFESGISAWQLLLKLTEGDVTQSALTIIEGSTFAQMKKNIQTHPAINKTVLHLPDQEILRKIGAQNTHPEGWFFPDTYYFASGANDISILRRAHRTMQDRLAEAWRERAANLPYASPFDALIMASIIEKETGQAQERPYIAAVFVNRLRKGMKLQTDPTVIYGLGDKFDGNLRKRDLQTDTAYNTYTRDGLPPTPIALPGWASLHAALHPSPSNYLYFVARGDGTSHFSSNLEDHNRAVAKYQRGM